MKTAVTIRVNGLEQKHEVEPRTLLVHFLRDCCRLTGTHVGCETSICGACTVLFEGKAVKSCTLLAVKATGRGATRLEVWPETAGRHRSREGSWERQACHCAICTPGL